MDIDRIKSLSIEGKLQIALAFQLLHMYKTKGKMDIEAMKMIYEFNKLFGVQEEYDFLTLKLPPYREVFK